MKSNSSKEKIVTYEIRFKYYQYNDGRANNGIYTYHRSYDTLKEARKNIKPLKEYENWLDWGYNDPRFKDIAPDKIKTLLFEEYHIDGFMTEPSYIVKVTKIEKVMR